MTLLHTSRPSEIGTTLQRSICPETIHSLCTLYYLLFVICQCGSHSRHHFNFHTATETSRIPLINTMDSHRIVFPLYYFVLLGIWTFQNSTERQYNVADGTIIFQCSPLKSHPPPSNEQNISAHPFLYLQPLSHGFLQCRITNGIFVGLRLSGSARSGMQGGRGNTDCSTVSPVPLHLLCPCREHHLAKCCLPQ